MRHCGICQELTNKGFCWRCDERIKRMNRAIAKRLMVLKRKS